MGASGAGKTSLMNALSDRISTAEGNKLSGKITVNDSTPLTQKVFGNYATYVMQDDVLFGYSLWLRRLPSLQDSDSSVMSKSKTGELQNSFKI